MSPFLSARNASLRWTAFVWIAAFASAQDFTGSKACAGCHREIFERYRGTPMALTSGVPEKSMWPSGEVAHYRMEGELTFDFSREQAKGERKAAYFIGSGAAARSFLWQTRGFLFQLPVTWYAAQGWGLSPGYENGATLQLARPIEPECLGCHTSRVKAIAGTVNGYEWPPANEPGIGCERCHGGGSEHIRRAGRGGIVNPVKLPPLRRDGVCAQCHLTGVERVAFAGRDPSAFRPGEDFHTYATAFVWNDASANPVHVASHFERLATSGCAKAAGEKLWCGSCHDSHSIPPPAERAAFYRKKCLACHTALEPAKRDQDCRACHMPSVRAADAKGAFFTDHSIPRRPGAVPESRSRGLRAFRGQAAPREAGIAWARIAHQSQIAEDYERALSLLREAYSAGARDPAMLTTLAFLEDRAGGEDRALPLYELVQQTDPSQTEALVNLGAIYAKRGRYTDAGRVWNEAVKRSPGLEAACVKLATLHLATERKTESRATAQSCLEFHPDSPALREILSAR